MKELSENNRFCSIQDINQTCHKYKYEIITADGDMIDLNLQNNDKNTLMPIYNALRLNIMFIYKMGRWAFNQRTFTPQGLKDIRVTYVKEDTILLTTCLALTSLKGFSWRLHTNNVMNVKYATRVSLNNCLNVVIVRRVSARDVLIKLKRSPALTVVIISTITFTRIFIVSGLRI